MNLKLRAAAVVLAAVLYVLLPTDLVPDFMPLVGWLDDVLVGAVAAWAVYRRLKASKAQPPGGRLDRP